MRPSVPAVTRKPGPSSAASSAQPAAVAVHWAEGALAEDIAWSKLTGVKPLQPWADTVAFTDMESVRFLNMPIIEAFKDFALLDAHYPGAVFMLNTRRVEDWINAPWAG